MTELGAFLVANPEVTAVITGLIVAVIVSLYKRCCANETAADVARVKTLATTIIASVVLAVATQAADGSLTWRSALIAAAMAFAASQGWYALGKGAVRTAQAVAIPPFLTPTLLVLLLLLVPLVPAHAGGVNLDLFTPDRAGQAFFLGQDAGADLVLGKDIAHFDALKTPAALSLDIWKWEDLGEIGAGLSLVLDRQKDTGVGVGAGYDPDRKATAYLWGWVRL